MKQINGFEIRDTNFESVHLIEPFYIEDERGLFTKDYEKEIYKDMGLENNINEHFESYSKKDVIRGLHFQTKNPQIKIVRVISGRALDVIVDLRRGSNTFGKHEKFELSSSNPMLLWIPAGFAHGFRAVSDEGVIMSYMCIGKYEKGFDSGVRWNDPDLGIEWGIDNPILSERDAKQPFLSEFLSTHGGL